VQGPTGIEVEEVPDENRELEAIEMSSSPARPSK
jgi:hypothetical protein